ncbi:MAG: citrate/2-methylcitrate synthase [Desulfobacterales bacterium]
MGNLTDKPELNEKKGKIGNLDSPKNPFDYMKREYGTVPLDTGRAPFQWVSEVAYKNVHRIVSRGYDTTEVMEEGYGVVDMLFIDYQARIPLVEEEQMLNYVMILALEDGLSMPAVMSRMVAKSKTFLTQAAGASILAFGHAYGAYSAFGNRLENYLNKAETEGLTLGQAAELLVKENIDDEALGVSNLMLKDPAAKRMMARAEKLGVAGKYIEFTKEIVKAAQELSDKPIDLDMMGATGAIMLDLGFSPEATWAILAVTRAFATGAHYIEEVEREGYCRTGQTLTPKEFYDGPEDRPVPPLKDRSKVAKSGICHTVDEWVEAREERKKLVGSGHSIIEEIEDPSKKSGIKKVGKL